MHLTLTRLMIIIVVLVLIVSVGIAWLWNYAYSPAGRARTVFCEMRKDTQGLRPWLLRHGVIRSEIDRKLKEITTEGDRYPPFWEAAEERIAELGPQAGPALAEVLADPKSLSVKVPGMIALGGTLRSLVVNLCCEDRYDAVVLPLTDILLDENADYNERDDCIFALRTTADARAMPALLRTLKAREGFLRVDAAIALADFGDRRAIPAVRELLSDKSEFVRQAAAEALRKLDAAADGQAVTRPATTERN